MTLVQIEAPLVPPWNRPGAGALDRLVVRSELLAGNPLGDPASRPPFVYRSPGVVAGVADQVLSVYVLQGYSGQLDGWLARKPFEPTFIERLDAMFSAEGSDLPDAVIVFVDAWTALGGSQFLNSTATGRYTDYVCEEVVPFIDASYPTAGVRERRGISGHSSGGYGALALSMLRPDLFGGLVAHAPDALFEVSYLPDFPRTVRTLRDGYAGSFDALFAEIRAADHFDWARWGVPLSVYAMAAAYSPDPDRPGGVLLPFDTSTGELVTPVWERWLRHDPVRMAERHRDALRSMRHIHVEAGRADEHMLDIGAMAFVAVLRRLGVAHTFELFEGGHGGVAHRYGPAIATLLRALAV
ncbi:MAG: alpha/beta hydrolase [Solirubrobacteraceae bacterium]